MSSEPMSTLTPLDDLKEQVLLHSSPPTTPATPFCNSTAMIGMVAPLKSEKTDTQAVDLAWAVEEDSRVVMVCVVVSAAVIAAAEAASAVVAAMVVAALDEAAMVEVATAAVVAGMAAAPVVVVHPLLVPALLDKNSSLLTPLPTTQPLGERKARPSTFEM